ncbi:MULTISPECIES: glycosyltransferase [Marinobacter]|uniref:glycosyltransferase n=1 Tax=Marinobacter TaxID=2742 RepID=UPI00124582A0|nr:MULTISPECIES: glycosyltransferase [Marinobacter]MBL3556709.1 glycosyltransferase [Marinobacter sp. JB05H06]
MSFKLAVVVNKDGNELGPSETFLHAHINGMPCSVVSLVGNPGYRMIRSGSSGAGAYMASRALLPLGVRWLQRKVTGCTVATQDTSALKRFLERNQVDAVLAEYGPTAVSVMEACTQAGVPLVAQFHGYDAYRESLLAELEGGYRQLFNNAAAIVGVSTHMCEQLSKLGAPAEKLFHNACGADVADEPASLREHAARFLMVGRLVEKKAPFVSLLAFAELLKHVPDARLEVIGDGPLKTPCLQLAKALSVDDRIRFSGAQSHDYVLKAMKQASGFVQHSVRAPDGDMEGTPVGVLEAMGMGLPVVSTRHGGIRDIIEEGETGLLVDEYDATGMAEALVQVATKPEYAKRLGAQARARVLQNWTTEKSVGRLWEIIQKSV